MITISIEPADNGVVKFIIDDNINGGGEEHVARRVYDFESGGRYNQVKFLNDLTLDLGMEIGTSLDPDKVNIELGWGSQYSPSQDELKNKVRVLEQDLKHFKSLIK